MWQSKRSVELEILDLGPEAYTPQEYNHCLKTLGHVNRYLGGFKAIRGAIQRLTKPPASILEIGCGGGYLCHQLHNWLPQTDILGIDICPEAIQHAQEVLPSHYTSKVSFDLQKNKSLDFPENRFECVISMLVCHHMSDNELVTFLQESYRICSHSVILNDLHRHLGAYVSFSLIAPIAFRNRLIWHDGRLSIKRAFRKQDWITLLAKAGFQLHQYTLKWNWAFRWTLTLHKR